MNSFLSEIKNSSSSSKTMSLLLINIFQIQLSIAMIVGTQMNVFESIEFVFAQNILDMKLVSLVLLIVHIGVVLMILAQMAFPSKSFIKSKLITKLTVGFINCYRNICLIPVLHVVFRTLAQSRDPQSISLSAVNGLVGIGLCYFEEMSGKTYRFRVKNYHQKLTPTFTDVILITFVIGVNCLQSPMFGSIILICKNIYRVTRLYSNYQEPIIQRTLIFNNLYQLMVSLLVMIGGFMNFSVHNSLPHFLCILIFGYIIVKQASNGISLSIYSRMLATPQTESQNMIETQEEVVAVQINKIRGMAMVLMEKQNFFASQTNEYNKWWQFYNREIINHQVWCELPRCPCKTKNFETQEVYLMDIIYKISQLSLTFTKDLRITIMNIYQYIELAKKPLKAYYELMRLKLESKKGSGLQVELNELTIETRECFDQLFLKHKVKNQKLELTKVIEFEELLIQSEFELKQIVTETIRFYSLFNHTNLKLSKIKQESNQLIDLKTRFESKLLLILNDYSSNTKLSILIHFFYNFIEVYLNKESELKKITQSQLLKKRFSDKTQVNVFCPDYGTILIDLAEEKGKIKNLTKNMCQVFGYPKEDMTSMNINQFMPRLFGYHHHKFLNNFIEKGKIKLLTYSERDIFGKNKKKFIFPLKVSLKAEYLQDNFFGSSGLVKQVQTFSEFIMVDRYGKIQEMTESLYRKIFATPFQEEPQKVNRLHINKVIPSFNFFFDEEKDKYDKLCEGILLFCNDANYLMDKFRFVKDIHARAAKTMSANSKDGSATYSMAVSSSMSKTQGTVEVMAKKGEHKAMMMEVLKIFITEIDLGIIEGYKISYKVSQVVTAEFEADLIEIVNIKSFTSERAFCDGLVEEFEQIVQIFQFNHSEHTGVMNQLDEFKSQSKKKSEQGLHSKTFNSSNGSGNNLIVVDGPRHVKATKQEKSEEEIRSVDFAEENKFVEENEHLLEKASTNRSGADNLENESKKQVLVNTFSNENLQVDSRYSIVANVVIGMLIVLLVCLLVVSLIYMQLLASEWTSVNFIQKTKQLIEYRSSLEEIEKFAELKNSTGTGQLAFVDTQTRALTNALKLNLQSIYESVVEEQAFNSLYTQEFSLESVLIHNTVPQTSTQQVSLISLLKQLFWRFTYTSDRNTQFVRSTYDSFSMQLRQLEAQVDVFAQDKENYLYMVIFSVNCAYLLMIIIMGIGIIPIFVYFSNEEKALTELLEYISFTELKKSIQKLNIIQYHLTKIDTIHNLAHMKNQFNSSISAIAKDHQQTNRQHSNNPKIIAEAQSSGTSTGKFIFYGILLVIFLNNLSIFMLVIVTDISTEFNSTIKLNKVSYELQNKPAYLLNTYLKNVNYLMSNRSAQQFTRQLFFNIEKDYFRTVSEISTPIASDSKIYDELQSLLKKPVCVLVQCSYNQVYNKTTMDYLVYQFRNKFEFLSKNTTVTNKSLVIPTWLEQNKIPTLLESIQTILSISSTLNPSIALSYHNHIKVFTQLILIINIVLIIVNSIVLLVVKNKIFGYFSLSIKETLSIFRHFDLETLSENTYLTSYFSNKLKEAK